MQNINLVSPVAEAGPDLNLDLAGIKKTAVILRAINHKLRLTILKLIAEKDQITVSEIYSHLLLEQSVASQHLAILRKAGFVKTKRNGKFIYYSVNRDKIAELNRLVGEFTK